MRNVVTSGVRRFSRDLTGMGSEELSLSQGKRRSVPNLIGNPEAIAIAQAESDKRAGIRTGRRLKPYPRELSRVMKDCMSDKEEIRLGSYVKDTGSEWK